MVTAEDFQKIPGTNKVNIFIVKKGMEELIWNKNLRHLLEAKMSNLKNGEHFSKNRWLVQKIIGRIRKTSSSHILDSVSFNGVEAYDKLFATYLKQDKVDMRVQRLETGLDKLRLRMVGDVHGFFSVV